jgi:hypothetical protein
MWTFSYARSKSVRVCGLMGVWICPLILNLGTGWTWVVSFRLQPFYIWERVPDVSWRLATWMFEGEKKPCLSLESNHDYLVLQLVATTELFWLLFCPQDSLYFRGLNYAKGTIPTKSPYTNSVTYLFLHYKTQLLPDITPMRLLPAI